MNKAQISFFVFAAFVSLLSIIISPKIDTFATDRAVIEKVQDNRAKNEKIFWIYIPCSAFAVAGMMSYKFRNKKRRKKH
jgi:hypothetical protein